MLQSRKLKVRKMESWCFIMALKSGESFTITTYGRRTKEKRYDSLFGMVFVLRIGLEIGDGHIMGRRYEIFTSQDSFAIFFDQANIL
jgi:hypothetical protein